MADTTTALDQVQAQLDIYGLGSLASWAWQKMLDGETWDQIYPQLRQTTEYKAIYPAMEELSKTGRSMTEGEYRTYTKTVTDLSHQFGIPGEMYATPQGVAKMMLNGVSITEATERFQLAAVGAITAPQEVKDAYQNLYGLHGGALLATYLDADKALPLLERQAAAAQIAGASYLQKTAADITEAERLAAQGVTFDQAVRGYGTAKVQEGLDYAAGMSTTRADRVAAQFGDTSAAARVAQAQAARQAQFQGSGGLAGSSTGITALSRESS